MKPLYRIIKSSFDLRKLALIFPFSLLCSALINFGVGLFSRVENFFLMSLAFFPIIGGVGAIIGMGFFLIQLHSRAIKQESSSYWNVFVTSLKHLFKISYLLLPVLLIFVAKKLITISLLGVLVLLQDITFFGQIKDLIFSSMPTIVSCWLFIFLFVVFFTLFLVTPSLALKEGHPLTLVKEGYKSIKVNPLLTILFFILSVMPSFFVLLFSMSFNSFYLALFLAPTMTLFFNFATEHFLLSNKEKEKIIS